MPSTWHGGKGSNGHDHRVLAANTFIPPAAGLSTSILPLEANNRDPDSSITSPTRADDSPRLARIYSRLYTHSITSRSATGEEDSDASAAFTTAPTYGQDAQLQGFDHTKMPKARATSDDKSATRGNKPVQDRKLIPSTEARDEADTLEPSLITAETAVASDLPEHVDFQSQPNEHFREIDGIKSTEQGDKNGSKAAETPTKSPVRPNTRSPRAYAAESASSCFYPLIPPYPYSPYGFHPIQQLMPNPITPQGGPIMYDSFGQSYYNSTPYSDMYTMYPVMQHYSTSPAVETPTRPSISSQSVENRQRETRGEAYGMSPNGGKKPNGEDKGETYRG